MPTTVTRRYHFESAHWLPKVPETHRCRRPHGHNYFSDITITDDFVDPNGFIIDFWDLDKIVQPLLDLVDHHTLNNVEGLENPTAELIAMWFAHKIHSQLPGSLSVHHVRVYETRDCWADYYPEKVIP